jgi:HSP20 family protein
MAKEDKRNSKSKEGGLGTGLGGILTGLANLVENLAELAEKGQEVSKTGEILGGGPEKGVRGIYGFNVKFGLGGEQLRVEPFGNIRKDETSGQTVVQEIREPIIDIFEEKDFTLVLAEIPGIGLENVRLEIQDDLLTVHAEKGDKKYRKEVLLPRSYSREKMVVSCNNGILEIKCFA